MYIDVDIVTPSKLFGGSIISLIFIDFHRFIGFHRSLMDFRRFFIGLLFENRRFEQESIESETLQSGTFNFWKREGAQKAAFSVLNLSSQMHFGGNCDQGVILKDFKPL